MKFLVASIGNRLESYVAKRFEHAAWYLIVDSETHALDARQHITPQDRHRVLDKAAAENVHAVIAGKFGENSLKLIQAHEMYVALLHGMSAQQALEKIAAHEIKLQEAKEIERQRGILAATPQQRTFRNSGTKVPSAAGHTSDSARGQHHLQQYGGRGH
jgi:predicted Fe-Mo cluster-binding NifX family protein